MNEYLMHMYNPEHYRKEIVSIISPLMLKNDLSQDNVMQLPLIYKGEVIIPYSDGTIKSFKEGTKDLLWEIKIKNEYKKIPDDFLQMSIHNNTLLINLYPKIYLFDLLEKDLFFENDSNDFFSPMSNLFYNNNITYYIKGNKKFKFYRTDIVNKINHWEREAHVNTHFTLLKDNNLIITGGERNCDITCIDFSTGETIWEKKNIDERGNYFNETMQKTEQGHIRDSALIFEDKLIVPINGFHIIAFNFKTGNEIWQTKIDSTMVNCYAYYGDKLLYALGLNFLFFINPTNGEIINKVPIREEIDKLKLRHAFTHLTVIEKYIFFIYTQEGLLIAMNKDTGKFEWTYDLGAFVPYYYFPLIVNNRLYALTEERRLFVFEEDKK